MEYCPMCQSEDIELMDEEAATEDGTGIDAYYACEDCGCAWVEHIFLEILDDGIGET